MKKYIILLITFLIISFHTNFFIETNALKNFKKVEQKMIFESDADFIDDPSIFNSAQKITIFSSIGEKAKDKRLTYESKKEQIQNRIQSLSNSIAELEQDITDAYKAINDSNRRINNLIEEIELNEKKTAIIQRKISVNKKILEKYLLYIYQKGDTFETKGEIDIIKSFLISGEDMATSIDDIHYNILVQLAGKRLIDEHRKLVSQLYEQKIRTEKQKNELSKLRKSLVIEKNLMAEKKKAREDLLEFSQGEEKRYQEYIKEQLEVEKKFKERELAEIQKLNSAKNEILSKYNCELVEFDTLEENTQLSDQCLKINKMLYAESKLAAQDLGNPPLQWPVLPKHGGISAFFTDAGYRSVFGTDHDAIDIPTPQGTEIFAPADGYVVYVLPPTSPAYSYFAIKHADGLISVYGHVNEILVNEGDFVNKGDLIGKTGGAVGTKGAGPMTTGAHLHFAMYKNGVYADPLEFLDISILNYDSLPGKYEYKYLSDFKRRKGQEFDKSKTKTGNHLFVIKGENEIERQKYLLEKYAAPAFRDWNLWVQEAFDGGLDPTFLMCIGLAESGLGRNLKTGYNVGNVGNTDSGGTYTFSGPREGINWMVKTINNKILGHYTEIRQLSRYGNSDGPIYASSPENWHMNVVKCMSHVKGEYVPDDYNYRVKK